MNSGFFAFRRHLDDKAHLYGAAVVADRDWNAARNLERLAASSAVSACGEKRSGAARRIRVKRAPESRNRTALASFVKA